MSVRDGRSLYQDLIVDHGNSPRNEGALEGATHAATQRNPLCGDRVTVSLRVEGSVIRAARFEARGCLIARASASILTEQVAGRQVPTALQLASILETLVAGAPGSTDAGPLEPLRGAREFPARRACVMLPWRALVEALKDA
jgi:nitrogen fixation NifU-like protein